MLLAALLASQICAEADLEQYRYVELKMGVRAELVFYASSQNQAERAARSAFDRIETLEQIFSDYRESSEARTLERTAYLNPVKVSPEMWLVLRQSERMWHLTGGAFDITAGPIIDLWRTARELSKLPSQKEIKATRQISGFENLRLKNRTLEILVKGLELDFGGIVKGFACDEAMLSLRRHGVTRASIVFGGDLKVGEPPPGEKGWTIRVQGEKEPRILANIAMSTSGDTEQFVMINGTIYSHIIDPRTGQAITNRMQATVVANEGLLSDPLATALCVDGFEGLNYVKRAGARATLIMAE